MTISAHRYHTIDDLHKIQTATAHWIKSAGFLGYINVSDIKLRLFNGMRQYDPGDIIQIWEESGKEIIGWAMVYPAWNSYEAILHPDFQQHGVHNEILDWAEHETIGWIQKHNPEQRTIVLDVFDGDTVRRELLDQRGYARGEQWKAISVRDLTDPIPEPKLPDGYVIRNIQGEHEIDKLVTHINDSFGWNWTVETYLEVVRSPGYQLDNEMIVVAPDGRFAASCILLPDVVNHAFMFENVATSPDFRRMGLGKALLYAGMQRMKEQDFTLAMVPHIVIQDAAPALYASVGFQPTYPVVHYVKPVA